MTQFVKQHLGAVRYTALILVACMTVLSTIWLIRTERQAHGDVVLPTTNELGEALIRAGLDAQSLTAAGVAHGSASGAVGGIVSDIRDALTETPTALASADSTLGSARSSEDSVGRLIRCGKATEQQVSSYSGLVTALSSAQSGRQSILNGLFTAGIADLTSPQKNTLTTIRANRQGPGLELPLQYLVVERTEAQWVQLRDALAHERTALAEGQEVDPIVAAFLAQVRADTAVSTASANLVANLALVQSSWNSQVQGQ